MCIVKPVKLSLMINLGKEYWVVGYKPNGYKVWDAINKRFVIVKDVIVDEIDFLKSRSALEPECVNTENIHRKNGRTQESRAIESRLGQRADIVSKYTSYRQEVSIASRLPRYYNATIILRSRKLFALPHLQHLSAGIKPPNERSAIRGFNLSHRRAAPETVLFILLLLLFRI